MATLQAAKFFCWRMGAYDAAVVYGQGAVTLSTASGDVFQQVRASGLLGRPSFSILLLCSPPRGGRYLLRPFSGMISELSIHARPAEQHGYQEESHEIESRL
jgi:hypothetical protein